MVSWHSSQGNEYSVKLQAERTELKNNEDGQKTVMRPTTSRSGGTNPREGDGLPYRNWEGYGLMYMRVRGGRLTGKTRIHGRKGTYLAQVPAKCDADSLCDPCQCRGYPDPQDDFFDCSLGDCGRTAKFFKRLCAQRAISRITPGPCFLQTLGLVLLRRYLGLSNPPDHQESYTNVARTHQKLPVCFTITCFGRFRS